MKRSFQSETFQIITLPFHVELTFQEKKAENAQKISTTFLKENGTVKENWRQLGFQFSGTVRKRTRKFNYNFEGE